MLFQHWCIKFDRHLPYISAPWHVWKGRITYLRQKTVHL